jgi:predicted nucleic acid-binding protein
MSAKLFIDSNVFLYAVEEQDPAKSRLAEEWLRYAYRSGLGTSNLQVMNEITNVLLKRVSMPPEQVFAIVDGFSALGISPISRETVAAARIIRFETAYAWWDCLLLASAMELGCREFLSEDLRDGHAVRGLTIVNPFRHSPPRPPLH